MPVRAAILISAVFIFLAPSDVLLTLFVSNLIEVEFLRLVVCFAAVWAGVEMRAQWRGVPISRQWQAIGWLGIALLLASLLLRNPILTFFALPLLAGSSLNTAASLVMSWGGTILDRYAPPGG